MRRVIVIAAAVALLGVPAAATAAPSKRTHTGTPKCPPTRNDVVLAADTQSVIYRAPFYAEMAPPYIFACAYSSKRLYKLGRTTEGSAAGSVGTGPFALAGPVVAYDVGESFTVFETHFREEIWVRNLATGRVIYRMPNGSPAEPEDVGIGETTAIVVKGDGSVAWIARASRQLGSIQVRSVDKTGSHLLAASPEIEPDSLALAGSTLYWMQGGKPMSATLD